MEKEEEGEAAEAGDKSNDTMGPVAIGQKAVEMRTWRQVYDFSQQYEKHRRLTIGKRALEMREAHEHGKHRTMDIASASPKNTDKSSHRPPAGNTDRIRKLVGMRPVVKKQERPFGGVKFLPSAKKHHHG